MLVKYFNILLDDIAKVLSPSFCLLCNYPGFKLCPICKDKLQRREEHICHVCKYPCDVLVHKTCKQLTNLDGVFTAYRYNSDIETLLQHIKYHLYYKDADIIANLIYDTLDLDKILNDSIIVCIPLSEHKLNFRGFNQVDKIFESISELLTVKYLKLNLLIRTKNTKTQVGMHKHERTKNLSNAFDIDNFQHTVFDKFTQDMPEVKIVLFDDIYTTGTTMEECANVLRTYFSNKNRLKIYGLAFARG